MSYIGNAPISAAFLTDTFSGTGSQTAFTMTVAPANTSSIIVAITGVLQDPSTYSVSGTTLTFSAAPPSGTSNISVRYLGIPASGVTTTAYRTVTEFTATSGQTSFSVPSYTVGYIDVYRNGVMLGTADFTATTGTTVVLASGATTGDLIRTESFYVSSVLNAVQQYNGSSTSQTLTTPIANTLTSGSGSSLQLQSNGGTTAVTIATNQAITVASTGSGITYSSSAGSGLRMYGAAGTNQWDVYGNGANIRFSDNTGGGIVVVDTAARIGSTIGVGGTTPSSSGAGVTFPATQSASSNANTLDDYEEGTWTPTITGGGSNPTITYSTQSGAYTKVGRQVTITGRVSASAASGGSGQVQVSGLPFDNGSSTVGFFAMQATTSSVLISAYLDGPNTYLRFYGNSPGNAFSAFNLPVSAGFDLIYNFSYFTS